LGKADVEDNNSEREILMSQPVLAPLPFELVFGKG
jgi:hypothetical protein